MWGNINIHNTQLDEIILTVLTERSFGEYSQIGALRALTDLLQKFPLLLDVAQRKSSIVAKKLSELI